jgi:hypothetical protein
MSATEPAPSGRQCPGCGKTLPTLQALQAHIIAEHTAPRVTGAVTSTNERLQTAIADPKNVERAATTTLETAAEELRGLFRFKRQSDAFLFLLIAFETYIVDLLDVLVNLGVKGPISSGKTTLARAFALIGKNVELAATATAAAIPALAAISNALVIDRVDRRLKSTDGPTFSQMLDAGYERGLPYRKMVFSAETGQWSLGSYDVFGVRVLTYVEGLESLHSSTASRTPEVVMLPARSGKVRRAARRLPEKLAAITIWLRTEAERALGRYDRASFRALEDSKAFSAFSDGLDAQLREEREGEDRLAQMAESLWLIGVSAGWDVEPVLRDWLDDVRRAEAEAALTEDPKAWTEKSEAKWIALTEQAIRAFVGAESNLRVDGSAFLVPIGWSWRPPLVGVLTYVGTFGGLSSAAAKHLPTPVKATVKKTMRRLGLFDFPTGSDRVSPRHDGGDTRVAVYFDAERLRRLGLTVNEITEGAGHGLLHGPSDHVRGVGEGVASSENLGRTLSPKEAKDLSVKAGATDISDTLGHVSSDLSCPSNPRQRTDPTGITDAFGPAHRRRGTNGASATLTGAP